ncbi:hypothetical protein PQG02_26790 [Nostoc sp. UHCC 0926]|nr:hypothetical protein [Nostoc sp. UHCC 0926]WDD32234.1 hypothetical protein PQG02_26790 [Nostoc sp. UHCC 0926]
MKDNVWGKALNRIVVEQISPEQGADQAIARDQVEVCCKSTG